MKISKRQLKRIIKEEQEKLVRQGLVAESRSESAKISRKIFAGTLMDLDDYAEFKDAVLSMAESWSRMTGYEVEDLIEAMKSIVEEI